MRDFIWALIFWQVYELLGLPLRIALARTRLGAAERRALSRVAGPVLLFLPQWLAAYFLPGMLHPATTWLWWLIAGAAVWVWVWRSEGAKPRLARLLAWDVAAPGERLSFRKLRFHLASELVYFGLFLGFVAFRRWVPEMTFDIGASAAEKFMNQMLFWSNWHATHLPAEDYWFAGHPIAYYDWGHAHWAWAGRAAWFPAAIVLNLALARVTLATVEAGFLLGRGLGLRRAWALGGAVAAAWFGNYAGVVEWLKLRALARQFSMPLDVGGYDFWAPSRAIKNVVDEFPAFSAILGDFHAHHLALPWMMTALALVAWGPRRFGRPILWGTCALVAALAATLANAWNLPLIGLACGVALLALLVRRPKSLAWALPCAVVLGGVLAKAVRFQRGGEGLPLVPGNNPPAWWPEGLAKVGFMPVPPEIRSTMQELFNLWGLPLVIVLLAVVALGFLRPWRRLRRLPRLPLAWGFAGAVALLVGLEFFYLQDRFVGEMVRYNPYFKFSYPAWPVLMLAAAGGQGGLWRVVARSRRWPARVWAGAVLVVGFCVAALGVVYPYYAMQARVIQARRGDNPPRRPTLSSVDFTAHRPPHDVEAPLLAYLRERVAPGSRIAEAGAQPPGSGAYDYGGRVASLAGFPVPLGWIHHEQQWRGPAWFERLDERGAMVDQLYRARSAEQARAAVAALGVKYAVFGLKERDKYGAGAVSVLLQIGHAEVTWLPPGVDPAAGAGIYLIRFD